MTLLYGADHPYARPARGTLASLAADPARGPGRLSTRTMCRPSSLRVVDRRRRRARGSAIDAVARRASATGGALRRSPISSPCRPRQRQADRRHPDARQAADRHQLRLHGDPAAGSALLRLLAAEQRARAVRSRRSARRQHPRTPGHGVLRLQRHSTRPSARARSSFAPASTRTTSSERSRRSTPKCEGSADGPTAAELEESREALIGSIPRMLETNEGIADFLQTAELFGLGLDYDRRLPDLLGPSRSTRSGRPRAELLDPDARGDRDRRARIARRLRVNDRRRPGRSSSTSTSR